MPSVFNHFFFAVSSFSLLLPVKGVQAPYLTPWICLKRCQAKRLNKKKGCWLFFFLLAARAENLHGKQKLLDSQGVLSRAVNAHGRVQAASFYTNASLTTGLVLLQTLADPWKSSSFPLLWSFCSSLRTPGLLVSFRLASNVCGIGWEVMAFSSVRAIESVASLLLVLACSLCVKLKLQVDSSVMSLTLIRIPPWKQHARCSLESEEL